MLAKVVEDPQSGSCPNVSYADISGPVANYNPTGSPFAHATGQAAAFASPANLNSSVTGNTISIWPFTEYQFCMRPIQFISNLHILWLLCDWISLFKILLQYTPVYSALSVSSVTVKVRQQERSAIQYNDHSLHDKQFAIFSCVAGWSHSE